ncbi:MAG: tRNA threonylcarbamoyladenosine dehydratase [Clostridiales bacterium]|nr:tRNA threonylcarbamoyladenosine dehydratase [Clostridiales bacterium]
MFRRSEILLGDSIQKLFSANVIIFGIGGVGGYTAEMLVRSGVGSITIVDYDVVDISNKNRQIIALDSTIGKSKVEVMKDRIADINKDCKVAIFNEKLTPENIEKFQLEQYDYVIDAIDMVASKVALIQYCKDRGISIVSAMGAGNRVDIPTFEVVDIYKTYNDGLAKVLRNKLKKIGILEHKVVFTSNIATPNGDTIGSIAYYPAMCGCVLSAYVIRELLERKS